jgi:hypothetical protein
MSILNTHSKALPQIVGEVFYFNNTGAAVTLRKGDALHYDPAMALSTAAEITAQYIDGGNWGEADASLPVALRARLVKRVIADGSFEFAGVLLDGTASIANNTGQWVKIALPGSVAQCFFDAGGTDTVLGARAGWDAGEVGFLTGATVATFAGAGMVVCLEAVDVSDSQLVWCKLMTGDASTATTGGLNMVAD